MRKNLSPNKILIVDDQENWSRVLHRLLEKEDYLLKMAGSIKEARKYISKEEFDIVILDIRLTDEEPSNVEGMALLNDIDKNHPNTKIIILTGYPEAIRINIEQKKCVVKLIEKGKIDIQKFKQLIREIVTQDPDTLP